jgi:hypothetical protein
MGNLLATIALKIIAADARIAVKTNSTAENVVDALREFDLNRSQQIEVLQFLGYCDETGTPLTPQIKKIWS